MFHGGGLVFINIYYLAIASIISFIVTCYLVKWWIVKAHQLGFTGKDMNKPGNIQVAEAGGVWVSTGVAFGLLSLIALNKYLGSSTASYELEFMALSLMLFMSSFLGFLDDLLGWKKGLKPIYRIVLMAPLSIPLVVIKAGYSKLALPYIGVVDLGLLYPLVLVPIGVLGASNAFNMIAGYNGLEAMQGILLMFFLSIFSVEKNLYQVTEASTVMIFALIAFLIYNKYPARVFPGNSFTYGVGAYYASLVILGNFEKYGVMLFTLYFIELILFLRGLKNGIYKENFGKVRSDGTLDLPYNKIYSITHFAIKIQLKVFGKATEKGVVYIIALLQLIIGILSLILIRII